MSADKSSIVKGVPFDAGMPKNAVTRAEAMRVFEDLHAQARNGMVAHFHRTGGPISFGLFM